METVLFAVLGMSPSVLSETVWALARESPVAVPDRVVVLTTTAGRQALAATLFDGDDPGWTRLVRALEKQGLQTAGKLRFGLAADHVRLFPAAAGEGDLADISTSEDNVAAADFILRTLRAETANPATRVFASIAGGRKTMGALLMSCMSLLGREQDRVLHVLVNPPFDTPLDPPFLFPERGVRHQSRDGVMRRSHDARIELIDVPFVRMRGWYEGAFKSAPPGYAALVAGVQRQAPPALYAPRLTLDGDTGLLRVEAGNTVALSPTEFAVVSLVLRGQPRIAETLCRRRRTDPSVSAPEWLHTFCDGSRFTDDSTAPQDFSKCLSSARSKLAAHSELSAFSEVLLPKRGGRPTYPASKITFRGLDAFADIRG